MTLDRYRWADVLVPCVLSTDPINRSASFSFSRLFASWLGGALTLYALEGLRGRTMSPAGWCTATALLLSMSLAEALQGHRPSGERVVTEFASLAAAAIILAWPLGWHEAWSLKLQSLVIARASAWLLAGVAQLASPDRPACAGDRAAVGALFACATVSLWMYMTPALVGPIDARWYGNVITDFLTQFRGGTFPVFSGETVYAFNGAVHPFRSAPWQFDFAAAVDVATRHTLSPVAVQHTTIILSYVAACLGLYTGLVRLRPAAKTWAFVLALVYATSTAMTGALVLHDMYMTVVGGPVIVAVLLLASRVVERPTAAAYAWLGAGCAFLWLCHPPLALLGLLLAAFIVLGHLAAEGPARSEIPAAFLGAVVFAVLAAPYFIMTRGLSTGPIFHPFTDILAPGAGLWLAACGLVQTLRRDDLRWLALAAAGIVCLQVFQPSLVPFAVVSAIFVGLLTEIAPDSLRGLLRSRPEPWLLCIGLLAAAFAESFFPRHDVTNGSVTAQFVVNSAQDPGSYFRPLFHGSVDQPGLGVWLLLGVAFFLCWTARTTAAVLGTIAAMILVVGLGFIPRISMLLWINVPPEFVSIVGVAYNLRLLPVLTPVVVTAVFLLLADMPPRSSWAKAMSCVVAAAMLAWAFWEHGTMLKRAAEYRIPNDTTKDYLSPDNVILQRYTWDLLQIPLFFSNGYMDPQIETRFLAPGPARDARNGPQTKPLIDAESIARTMEGSPAQPIDLIPTIDQRGADWLYFAPKIVVAPGEKKLLRFDFLGRKLDGWLILRGDHLYHEYLLPNSGTWWGFGSEAPNYDVLPVNNMGPDPIAIEIVYKRRDSSTPVGAAPFMRVWDSTYDSSRSPIAIEHMTPLRMRVEAPSDGILETYRSYYPGYEVLVDGRRVAAQGSYDGLLDVPLTKGHHEVSIRFKGTPSFVAASWWQMTAWALTGVAAIAGVVGAVRTRKWE